MRRCSAGEVWEMEKNGSPPSRIQSSVAVSVPGHVAKLSSAWSSCLVQGMNPGPRTS